MIEDHAPKGTRLLLQVIGADTEHEAKLRIYATFGPAKGDKAVFVRGVYRRPKFVNGNRNMLGQWPFEKNGGFMCFIPGRAK